MAIDLYSKASVDSLLSAKLSDAPIDGSTYGRKDGAWEIISGGGGLTISTLSNGATSTLNPTAPTAGQALTFDGTDLVWATVGGGSYLPLAGGAMSSTAIVTYSDATYDSEIGGWGFGVQLTSDTTQNASIQYNAVSVQNGSGTMTIGPTGLTFPDSTTQTTAASYDAKKAIANLCASCLTTNGTTIGFTNYIAIAVIQGSKFQSGSNYLIGIGTPGGTPSTLTLTSSSVTYADAGMSWGSYYGQCVCYSDDGGSTWTYSDLSF
jgi:hypothetical protein